MRNAEILIHPHPVLRRKCVRAAGDPREEGLRRSLVEVLGSARGAGLAAPQIGVPLRAFAVAGDVLGEGWRTSVFVDPVIVASSGAEVPGTEGCLSIPGQYAEIERPEKLRVKYLDENGQPQEIEADGLLATCLQHEIDHLDGILFTDHLSSLKRDMVLRKLKKWTREHEEDMKERYVLP